MLGAGVLALPPALAALAALGLASSVALVLAAAAMLLVVIAATSAPPSVSPVEMDEYKTPTMAKAQPERSKPLSVDGRGRVRRSVS